jgi:hypothetical protein
LIPYHYPSSQINVENADRKTEKGLVGQYRDERRTEHMAKLVEPHGGKGLTICLLEGAELKQKRKRPKALKSQDFAPRQR